LPGGTRWCTKSFSQAGGAPGEIRMQHLPNETLELYLISGEFCERYVGISFACLVSIQSHMKHNFQAIRFLTKFRFFEQTVTFLWIEILTTVIIKNSVVWDIALCSPFEIYRRFGGTCSFHVQGRRRNQLAISRGFFTWLIHRP
jgi:hypothetical protein